MKPIVAAFDFDGTLSRGVSGLRFFRHLLGDAAYTRFWLRQLPALIGYGLRFHHESNLEKINRHIFTQRKASEIEAAGQKFAREHMAPHLIKNTVNTMLEHRDRGDRCVIVSRGYEAYLKPWARDLGIEEVLSTRLEADGHDQLTGNMPEPSCDGEEKVRRLRALMGDRKTVQLLAYGDGPGDHALFREADLAYVRKGSSFVIWKGSGVHA